MSDISENKSNKRRRWLDDVYSAASPRCITDLPDVLIKACLSFVGPGQHNLVARTCHSFQEHYPFAKETAWESAAASVSCAKFCLDDNLEEGEMSKEQVLWNLQRGAARTGRVCVLEWIRQEHGFVCGMEHFVRASAGGHLNVLKWGKEHETPWSPLDVSDRKMDMSTF